MSNLEKKNPMGDRALSHSPLLYETWTGDQPHHFMQAPHSSHMHLSMDSFGVAYNDPVAP